uniref:Protein phosphatase 1 regulatory subunit 37 n=1 Tax=Xiphophorus couchianus TaxID=32473 RepID=A0A3B5LN71_9TELE
SLLDMILYYESTTYLDISDNGSMGTSSWRALAHLIKQSVCLSRLDACNVCLVDYPVQSLSKALLTSRLQVLHLNNVQLSGSSLFTLCALKINRALLELHLSSNQLNGYQDAMQLGDLLRYNSTLQTLELSDNVLGDALEELCDGLSRQTKGLKVLILKNNQITERGMNHLAKTLLQPGLKILEVLDLGDNHLGNEGIQVIREPLMVNSSLLHLGLAQSNITCEAVALAEFLAESRLIQRLDLHQNRVKLGGLMALSLALRINCSLSHLGDEFLSETQKRLQAEITQRCKANASRL